MTYQKQYEVDLKMKQVIYRDINDGIERGLKMLEGYIIETEEDYKKYKEEINNLIEICKPEEMYIEN